MLFEVKFESKSRKWHYRICQAFSRQIRVGNAAYKLQQADFETLLYQCFIRVSKETILAPLFKGIGPGGQSKFPT